jgi:hypothetical protein
LPPPRFELQISRLPGKGGYSTRPSGTTRSLIIWVEVYVASVTYFPPTEGSTARIGRSEKGLRRERRKGLDEGGESLVVVVVASGIGEAKAA